MSRDSTRHTFQVALILCLVCSFVVSVAAVSLRDRQQRNVNDARDRNVLYAAFPSELKNETQLPKFFENRGVRGLTQFFDRFVERRAVNLNSGREVSGIDPLVYDQIEAARDPELSQQLDLASDPRRDVAGIKRREDVGWVYLIRGDDDAQGRVESIVLPIRGYGLWSTLKGFVAIDALSLSEDPSTAVVRGLTYYSHGETPGLGGEVDNPTWKDRWPGRTIFDRDWNVKLRVVKLPKESHDVDALTGATITSNGVSNMIEFWLGADGYGPFLKKIVAEGQLAGGRGRRGDGD